MPPDDIPQETLDPPALENAFPVPIPGETKAEAFKRLAKLRMSNAMTKIRLLGNLANTSSYEYSPKQVEAMKSAIIAEVASAFGKFEQRDKDKPLFDFNE